MSEPSRWTEAWQTIRRSRIVEVTLEVVRCADIRRAIGLASESAFWVLLALVPLAAVSGMLVARLAIGDDVALGMLSRSLPPEARELVSRELAKVASYDGGRLGILATMVFVWLASSGVHAVLDVLEALAAVSPRAWWRKRLISIGSCLALAVAMGIVALLASPFVGALRAGAEAPGVGAVSLAAKLAAGAATDLALTVALYHVAFTRAERPSHALPGAVLAVALQALLGAAYAGSIRVLGDGSAYLAGLAVFAVTMTAVFIYMLSLLLGLSLNLVLSGRFASADATTPVPVERGSRLASKELDGGTRRRRFARCRSRRSP